MTTYYSATYPPRQHHRGGRPASSSGGPDASGPEPSGGHGLAYAAGLDGVRAIAVIAVLLYHLGTTGLVVHYRVPGTGVVLGDPAGRLAPGGFLGVDVFFVLSGFLITSLLLAERARTGRISIRRFYLRRARRLLPALYLMLLVVAAVAAYAYPDYAARLRGDLLAAVGYVTNWWLIAGGTSYFGAGVHPPLLTHLWSLAVEEQFYLFWPVMLIWLTRLRRRGAAITVVALMIAASVGLAAQLYQPLQDTSRVYYGTDTRLFTPLIGALLAIVVQPWRWTGRMSRAAGWTLSLTGGVALAGLGWAVLHIGDQDPVLYRGGFVVVALLSAVVVVGASRSDLPLGRVLGVGPLRWLGERSYAIYLWHWPIFAVTQPGVNTVLNGWTSTAIRIGATVLVSDLSFRLVERPIRAGGLGRLYRRWRSASRPRRVAGSVGLASTFAAVAAAIILVGGQLVAAAPASSVPIGPGPDLSLGALPSGAAAVPSASAAASASPSAAPSSAPAGGAGPASTAPIVAVFGDSQGMTMLINKPKDTAQYVHFIDDTIEGCGVLLGTVRSRSGEQHDLAKNCHSWLSTWTSRAHRDHPALALVIIGAWDVFDLTINGSTLTFGSTAWDANFSAQLQQGIDGLRSSGAPVALALLPCYRPVPGSAGYWPERGDDTRTRHVNTLLQAAAAADPTHVHTVNPPAQFCTNPAIAKSLSYRWDGVHYYKPGALLYCQVVIPQLLAILKP